MNAATMTLAGWTSDPEKSTSSRCHTIW